MDSSKIHSFCDKYKNKKFYQPVIFVPGSIEIEGKWHNGTKLLADKILNDCSNYSILDLGCMNGFFLFEAIKRGAIEGVGIDHDLIELFIGKEINDIFEFPIDFIHNDLEVFCPDKKYDIVLMLNILHVIKDPRALIQRFLQVASKVLVVEHEPKHSIYFPLDPSWSHPSPRAAGHRVLSLFQVPQE
jgi:SAM-dependent methyltransferase